MRVTYDSLLTPEEWEHHWSMAALQIKVSCPTFPGQGTCGYFTRLPARSGTRP
jgi:hypothetical protein